MATTRKPWDQQEGESDSSYKRFCYFLTFGPHRTLDKAYRKYRKAGENGAPEGTGENQAPGLWKRESSAYNWVERAEQWDTHNLLSRGRKAVVAFIESLTLSAMSACDQVDEAGTDAKKWGMIRRNLHTLAKLIPQETILAMLAEAKQHSEPADSGDVEPDLRE